MAKAVDPGEKDALPPYPCGRKKRVQRGKGKGKRHASSRKGGVCLARNGEEGRQAERKGKGVSYPVLKKKNCVGGLQQLGLEKMLIEPAGAYKDDTHEKVVALEDLSLGGKADRCRGTCRSCEKRLQKKVGAVFGQRPGGRERGGLLR